MPKMDERTLVAILAAEKADALSADQAAKLSEDREKAMDAYNGILDDMPSQPDRSKAVSSDVADTVEGLMPSLMEIFCGGDEVVRFNPVGPEDEPLAEQETDYVNHVMMQENDGFTIIYSFTKDALLSKNGIVKVHWEVSEEEEYETFEGQTEDVFAILVAAPGVEMVEHTQRADEETGEPLHDLTLRQKRKVKRCRVDPVPPEEFGCSRRSKLGQPLDYSFHQVQRTESQLIAMGFDKDQIEDLPDSPPDQNTEDAARDTVEDDKSQASNINKANRLITITEHYAMLDYEGDGKACLYRVTTAGMEKGQVLKRDGKPDINRVEFDPFAAMTPVIVTHRFFGKSIADLVLDIMKIKTALMRGMLDNVYLANNQRTEISESHATENTIDDLLNNRPGGIVRTKAPGGLIPIPNQSLGEFVFPAIEYMDSTREWRSGVVRQGQGIDADALQNQSATAVAKVYNAAQAKMKLIARIMAETGFRQLFWKIHATLRKNETAPQTRRLRNNWVTVNPREWKRRSDLTISVGLGSGGKSEQLMFWGNVLGIQKEAILLPGQNIVKPKNIHNTLKKYLEAGGEKAIDLYFSDPEDPENPPGEAPPDPKMIEVQGKLQMQEKEFAQRDRELEGKMGLERMQAEADIATNDRKVNSEMQIAREKFEQEKQLKLLEFGLHERRANQEATIRQQEADRNAVYAEQDAQRNARFAERDAERQDRMADRQMQRDDKLAKAKARAPKAKENA